MILEDAKLKIHIYCPSRAFVIDSFTAAPPGQDLEGGEPGEDSDVMAATVAQLPSLALEGIWDNLVYDGDVKARLLNYINSTQVFSDKRVDFNIITWNRYETAEATPLMALTRCTELSYSTVRREQARLRFVEH